MTNTDISTLAKQPTRICNCALVLFDPAMSLNSDNKALRLTLYLQRGWLTRFICQSSRFFRDRLLYDPRFLFIVLAEIAIDCGLSLLPIAAEPLNMPIVSLNVKQSVGSRKFSEAQEAL